MQRTLSLTSPATLAPSQRIGPAFVAGGALWIAHYALQLVHGGWPAHGPLALLDGFCFMGAIATLCTGLLLLAATLCRRGALAWAGIGFAALAAASATVGFFVAAVLHRPPGTFGGIGVVGSCLAATCVALAVRRVLPTRLANGLLTIGLLTFPAILAFTPFGQWVPAYLTDELPFALSGAAYIAFGRALSRLDA